MFDAKRTFLINGAILTMEPDCPRAEALAMEGQRLLAVGSNQEVRAMIRPQDEIVDLGGRCVLPGFEDAHLHFTSYGLMLQRLNLSTAVSLESALAEVEQAIVGIEAGQWLQGMGWNHNIWTHPKRPTRYDLDRVAPHTPVVLASKDLHSLWANSVALELAGVNASTPDPDGGQIIRDEAGEPTGIVNERAQALVTAAIPQPDRRGLIEAARLAMRSAASLGITSVHSCEGAEAFSALQALAEMDELAVRVWHMVPLDQLDAAIAMGLISGFGNDHLRIGHVKMFADGALGSLTAEMLSPYEDAPTWSGVATTDTDTLYAAAERAAAFGLSSAIHAIGDAANHRVLDVFERLASNGLSVPHPHRIEHVQLLAAEDLPRLSRYNVVASMQPIHATQDMHMADLHWGSRARLAYAWGSVMRSGAQLVIGTDCPVEGLDPLANIHAAVTRQDGVGQPPQGWYPEERLTLDQALNAYTLVPAKTTGQGRIKGSLVPGKLADVVVLSRDIAAELGEALLNTHVDMTWANGGLVYER